MSAVPAATALGGLSVLAVGLLLLLSGVSRLRRPRASSRAVHEATGLPAPAAATVAMLSALTEAVIGSAVLLGALAPVPHAAARWGSAAAALLLGCYLLYVASLATWRRGSTCGCDSHDLPANGWTVARTATMTGIAVLAWHTARSGTLWLPSTAQDRLLAALVICSLLQLLWMLPASMAACGGRREALVHGSR